MGIKGLGKIIKEFGKEMCLSNFAGKVVAVDTSVYLHKFMYGQNYIESFFNQLVKLLDAKITPVYIFDGRPPPIKDSVIRHRKDIKKKKEEKMNALDKNSDEYLEMKKHEINITQDDILALKQMLSFCGIPVLQAEHEADTLICKLARDKVIDAALTNDLDFLPGGTNILTNYDNRTSNVFVYILSDVLAGLHLTQPEFIDFCILCGSDYTEDTLPKIGPVNAKKLIMKHNTIEEIISNSKFDTSVIESFDYSAARREFLNGCETKVERPCLFSANTKKLKEFLSINTEFNVAYKMGNRFK